MEVGAYSQLSITMPFVFSPTEIICLCTCHKQATAATVMSDASMPMVVGSVGSIGQQGTTVLQPQTAAQPASGTTTVNTASLPQMLFLNQVTINGQTSFVLVDANNKPVQLPQGECYECIFQLGLRLLHNLF